MEWIISANLKIYDVIRAFSDRTIIDWRQSAKQQVGDIVYIYIGKPIQAVVYQTIVEEVGITYENALPDQEYWIQDSSEENRERQFMRLRLIETFSDDLFSLTKLLENGLMSAPQGPVKVKDTLRDYLMETITSSIETAYYEGVS